MTTPRRQLSIRIEVTIPDSEWFGQTRKALVQEAQDALAAHPGVEIIHAAAVTRKDRP